MTIPRLPKISYGHGWQYDGERLSGGPEGTWAEHEDGNVGAPTIQSKDYLRLTISSSTGNKVYYLVNGTALSLASTLNKKIRWRLRCSNASIKAKIELVFNGGATQVVLDETNSQQFIAGTADITVGNVIDYIRLYANNDTGYVEYDNVEIYADDWELPNAEWNIDLPITEPQSPMPGRITGFPEHLGSPSAIFECTCDLDVGNWKRSQDYINGQIFLEASHNHNVASSSEPWQWLDTGQGFQLKVTVHPHFTFGKDGVHQLELTFTEYSLGNKNQETAVERFGLNLS